MWKGGPKWSDGDLITLVIKEDRHYPTQLSPSFFLIPSLSPHLFSQRILPCSSFSKHSKMTPCSLYFKNADCSSTNKPLSSLLQMDLKESVLATAYTNGVINYRHTHANTHTPKNTHTQTHKCSSLVSRAWKQCPTL